MRELKVIRRKSTFVKTETKYTGISEKGLAEKD